MSITEKDSDRIKEQFNDIMDDLIEDGNCLDMDCQYCEKDPVLYCCNAPSWKECPRVNNAFFNILSEIQHG